MRAIWVRWDDRLVRIYNSSFEQIAIHPKVEPGQFQTHPGHLDPRKISVIEKGATYLLRQIQLIGPHSAAWSRALLERRGIEGMRTLQGFLSLTRRSASSQLERATRIATSHELFRLKDIRNLAKEPSAQEQLSFLEQHPLIRDMTEYETLVRTALTRKEAT